VGLAALQHPHAACSKLCHEQSARSRAWHRAGAILALLASYPSDLFTQRNLHISLPWLILPVAPEDKTVTLNSLPRRPMSCQNPPTSPKVDLIKQPLDRHYKGDRLMQPWLLVGRHFRMSTSTVPQAPAPRPRHGGANPVPQTIKQLFIQRQPQGVVNPQRSSLTLSSMHGLELAR
jgi:hypothetical protein